jgi:hypothetical protein
VSKPIPRGLAARALLEALNGHVGAGSDRTAIDELARLRRAPAESDPNQPSPALQRKLDELAQRAERAERKLAELTAALASKDGDQ